MTYTNRWSKSSLLKYSFRCLTFLVLYTTCTILLVPPIAERLGRVPLPFRTHQHLQPLRIWTCILNRHYVTPLLRHTILDLSDELHRSHPDAVIHYLDANFPFINGFPLVPHLSHKDGKKLDLTFFYLDRHTGLPTPQCPSYIGYGICEDPRPHEENTTAICLSKGYKQYNFLSQAIPQGNKKHYILDEHLTKDWLTIIARHPHIEKIFIEPHLKTRLGLLSPKIRFQGCQSVRHDDHIHLQIK
jgi:hypothetical protein